MHPELRFWRVYAAAATALLAGLVFTAFRAPRPAATKLDTLDVQRINIVGPDGALQMAISNRQDMPEGRMDGKTFTSQGRHDGAGLIFYNALGDEDGGLTFGAVKTAKGYAADAGLMFDQFKQDQTVGVTYSGEGVRQTAGLRVWQRPELDLAQEVESVQALRAMPAGPAKDAALARFRQDSAEGKYGAQRLFAGKNAAKEATVELADSAGHPRLRLSVAADGAARIDFLDARGKVVRSIAP